MTKLKLTDKISKLYAPSARRIDIVNVPAFNFIMIDGRMEEGEKLATSKSIQNALNALNGISYTLKFISKLDRQNPIDYNTMPLEGLWQPTENSNFKDRSGWQWTLMMMQPKHITAETFKNAVSSLRKKRSGIAALKRARFESFREGLAIQIMHVSSIELVPMSIDRMKDFARSKGYRLHGLFHEIYLSDPRLTKPEKQRIILRYPIAK